jgi:uncharacterized membrane protein
MADDNEPIGVPIETIMPAFIAALTERLGGFVALSKEEISAAHQLDITAISTGPSAGAVLFSVKEVLVAATPSVQGS